MKRFLKTTFIVLFSIYLIENVQSCKKKLTIPVMTTSNATEITQTSAISGGNVKDDGGAKVFDCGICWGTTLNPTTSSNKTIETPENGIFISSITGLTANTKYFLRAYGINSEGTSYGNEISFTTSPVTSAVLTTTAITSITSTTAVSGGNISTDGGSSITTRGVCWNVSPNPSISNNITTDASGSGSFVSNITNLIPGTSYYVKAYATNSIGTTYGNEVSFKTVTDIPTIITTDVTDITVNSAISGGDITSDGGDVVSARGVCWSKSQNPTTEDNKTIDGVGMGKFTSNVIDLSANTVYYLRAYAVNAVGTGYGNQIRFTSLSVVKLPFVTTIDAKNITATTATAGGNITEEGGSAITARGVCYGLSENPALSDNFTVDGTGTGQYDSQITNLLQGTTYYIRAYATNSTGTSYGEQVSFVTLKSIPLVTTKDITEISAMGGVSGGIITSAGGGTISGKGICWGELPNPTLTDNVINSGTGTSSFNSSIITAVPATTYYVRSYATNEIGTGYGDQKTFTASGDVNYYSFESGLLPSGWAGQWNVGNSKSYVGNYCLTSLHGVSSEASLTVTISNPGQISFYYYLDWSVASGFSVSTSIDFYIDDVLNGSFPSSSGWNQGLFNVSSGTHIFKWIFNARYLDGQGFIDYIIFPK